MNCKLVSSVPLCAALLLGCTSAPELTLPSGEWVEMDQPPAVAPAPRSLPVAGSASPALAPGTPALWAGVPPKAPVVISTAVTSVSPWGTPPGPIVSAVPAVVPTSGAAPSTAPKPAPPLTPSVANKAFPTTPPSPVPAVTAPVVKVYKPVPAPVLKPVWEARVGESLRTVIQDWSKRANYNVAWEAEDLDYPIDAPLRFEGTYEEAVAAIFDLYLEADRSFIVDGHREQKRLNVTEKRTKDQKRAP